MNEKIQRISKSEFIMESEKGEFITLIFNEIDNKDVENLILESLLTSYETRLNNKNLTFKI